MPQEKPSSVKGGVRAAMGYEAGQSPAKPAAGGAERDTSVKKVTSDYSPKGAMGQTYLASGKLVSMRLWEEDAHSPPREHSRPYETVGYVLAGNAELHLEGQTLRLAPGDCWVVPRGAQHRYEILDSFRAIEATAPPAEVHGRDES